MIDKQYIIIIFTIIFFTALIAVSMNASPYEISNNVTLIVEIGVGFIIAIIVYGISRKSESVIEKKVDDTFNIIKEREDFRKDQEHYVYESLLNLFNNIQTNAIKTLRDAEVFVKSDDNSEKEFYKNEIILGSKHIQTLAEKNLDSSFMDLSQFFDLSAVKTLKTISNVCKNEPIFSEDGKIVNVSFCNSLIKILEPWINEFNKKLEKYQEKPLEKPSTLQISVSLDRTVYPINSTVHLRANIPETIPNESIVFQIFNEKNELLTEKEISPEELEHTQIAPDAGIYETSFKMDDRWKVGETFQLKGIHGSSVAYDDALIDERNPIVQSDKSVYHWNEDMILTVIDPDADKDNDIPELVGDRNDSKLIISSSKSELSNYRLRETGDSTGIFQGILGFVGIEDDGKIEERNVNGKTITKTQGHEIDDGFIEVSKYDELKITYSNLASSTTLTVFVVKNLDHLPN